MTVAEAFPAVAVPMVGAPGTVLAAVMVVVLRGTGVAAGMGDELVRSEAGSAVVPVGQPCTVVEMLDPSSDTVAVESNSEISAGSAVPGAPEAVSTVLMVGKVTVAPAGMAVEPDDT